MAGYQWSHYMTCGLVQSYEVDAVVTTLTLTVITMRTISELKAYFIDFVQVKANCRIVDKHALPGCKIMVCIIIVLKK